LCWSDHRLGQDAAGEALEAGGLWGRRCLHFDFGAQLRAVGAGGPAAAGLTADQLAVVGNSLATGALLEDAQFPIAVTILQAFARRKDMAAGDSLVLNGCRATSARRALWLRTRR